MELGWEPSPHRSSMAEWALRLVLLSCTDRSDETQTCPPYRAPPPPPCSGISGDPSALFTAYPPAAGVFPSTGVQSYKSNNGILPRFPLRNQIMFSEPKVFPATVKRFLSLQIEPISGSCKHGTRDFSTSKNVAGGRVFQQKELEPTTPAKDTDIIIKRIQKSTRELEQGPVGRNLSSAEKRKFLVNTLIGLEDSREAVYGTLDAWVAFEQDFPLASLKQALSALEKEQQWHRIVQVIKWMLSKGQGNTVRTYEQLVCALEKDNRAEEAHKIWQKKIAHDLHSVPWRFCHLMLAIYYRNNKLERLVKLFKELEACGRKPPSKDIIRKVEDAYEMLGLLEEKKALLEKYKNLYNRPSRDDRRRGSKPKRTELDKTDADGSMQCKMVTSENNQDQCCPSDKESAVTVQS